MTLSTLSTVARVCTASIIALVLAACSSEDLEWIDIPLADNVFYEDRPDFRTDTIEIPLFALKALEYKLTMKQGHAVSYSWQANNLSDPEKLLIEFHGHTVRTSDAPGDLMFYKIGRGESSEGYMVAPFEGIHGWYFSNETDQDMSITLQLSGFYDLES